MENSNNKLNLTGKTVIHPTYGEGTITSYYPNTNIFWVKYSSEPAEKLYHNPADFNFLKLKEN